MKNDCVIHRHSIGQKEGVIFQQKKKEEEKKWAAAAAGGRVCMYLRRYVLL